MHSHLATARTEIIGVAQKWNELKPEARKQKMQGEHFIQQCP
ncbi:MULTISPECIES: hypothetical protein [unclassified Calothrix]|nr:MULTISPECIES: hypothetical protein [unclassified Calothrix]